MWMEEGLSLAYSDVSNITQISYLWAPYLISLNTASMPQGATLSSSSLELCSSETTSSFLKMIVFVA